MGQDGTWRGGGPQSRPHCARWVPSSFPPKRGQNPQFLAHFYCGQTAGMIKMPLATEIGLGPGDIVLDGDPAPPQRKGHSPQFSAHVYCGQTALCMRVPLGTEVGLSSPSPKWAQPQFSANVRCGHMAGWSKMSLDMEVDLGLGKFVFDGTQLPPRRKKWQLPHPIFGPCL